MSRQAIAPFSFPVYVNETGTRQAIVAVGFIDETQALPFQYNWLNPTSQSWQPWTQQQNLLQTTLAPTTASAPVGEAIYDLPPRYYPQPAQTWTSSYILSLIGKDKLPTGDQITDLPPRAYPEPATRTWISFYNLNLIGKDRLPAGEISTDLPPRAYLEPATRTWVWNYNLNLIGQDKLPVGEAIYDLPPRDYAQPAKTWTWNYNLNLIAQDRLPPGKALTDLPPRDYSRILQTWIASLSLPLTTVVQPLPFNQYTWPTPQPLTQPDRGFTAFYNPNLIAQDKLPVGARVTDLPPRDYPPPATRTWTFSYSLDLIGQDRFPPGARVFELAPVGPPHPTQNRTWTWAYNQNLIGQDSFPPGARLSDLPPRDYDRLLQTWVEAVNLALTTQPAAVPFNQFYWPLPQPLTQPDRSFSASYNVNLIGRDAFPPGARVTDLPPTGYEYPANLRFFSQSPAVPPPTPVVTTAVHSPHFFSTMGFSIGSPANPPS